jgi:dephospho-CoA kinase
MKVIGVVGLPASGKGEFSNVAQKMGIPVVVMGDAIRNALAEEGIAPTDENLGDIASRLRVRMGRDAIAQLTIPAIEAQDAPLVLVDGIRSDAEVQTFRSHFSGFLLIAVTAPFDVRFRRMKDRRRSDDLVTPDQLQVRDERELGWGLGEALAMADRTIENTSGLEEFRKSVRGLLNTLRT